MRRDIMCIGGTSQWPATIFRGVDQWGEPYGYLLVDPIGGAIGAFATGDGISTGGQSRTPICKLPNVEHTEQSFPLLFLYRKEITDSGGAGKWRGGMSAESCFIPHRTKSITQDTLSSGNAIPTSPGMMGGYPGSVNVYKFKRETDIKKLFSNSTMPKAIEDVKGQDETLQLRQENFQQNPSDVYAVIWSAAGGFGDPLERDPEKVRADVVDHRSVSAEAAKQIYGVLLRGESVDAEGTRRFRAERRAAYIAKKAPEKIKEKITLNLTDSLDLRGGKLCCAKCAADLGPATGNYKERCVRYDAEIAAANPNIGDWKRYIDERPVFRQFHCPGCGALLENEIAREDDELLRDIELS
ncbi:MAG TPA: hydantoinase B/oxoprolinase family protein, partial [Burkholderiales bacterium]|nr:hydantoinase B/oxoprolinase family protein [Burkholderiales bacterium]